MKRSALLLALLLPTLAKGGNEDFTVLDPNLWETRLPGPGAAVQLLSHELLLANRPQILSRDEWNGGKIEFDWRPSEGVAADDGHTYGDHLLVILSSDGSFQKERAYGPLNGVIVQLDSVTGDVYIQTALSGTERKNLAFTKGQGAVSHEAWTRVKIDDSGSRVVVSIDNRKVAEADIPPDARKGKRWGFCNREAVGPGMRSSRLRRLSWMTE